MERVVEPEWLDELPAQEPRAVHSRGDLRRLNWFMNHAGVLAGALRQRTAPRRVIDLGCGDGSFALRLAARAGWSGSEIVLVDRQPVISPSIRDGFAAHGNSVTVIECDVLQEFGVIPDADIMFTNLFLHHFHERELAGLLRDAAARCRVFVACEPRRGSLALFASRLVGLIGCNDVTRHDAPASVRAGFRDQELSRMWPDARQWSLHEGRAGLFSHLFIAQKL
jgi:SAM-dependent methyltransferase